MIYYDAIQKNKIELYDGAKDVQDVFSWSYVCIYIERERERENYLFVCV